LVHISNIANKRIPTPASVLKIGQEVEAQIIELDFARQKIGLSIKVLLPDYLPEVEITTETVETQITKTETSTEEAVPTEETTVTDASTTEETAVETDTTKA